MGWVFTRILNRTNAPNWHFIRFCVQLGRVPYHQQSCRIWRLGHASLSNDGRPDDFLDKSRAHLEEQFIPGLRKSYTKLWTFYSHIFICMLDFSFNIKHAKHPSTVGLLCSWHTIFILHSVELPTQASKELISKMPTTPCTHTFIRRFIRRLVDMIS